MLDVAVSAAHDHARQFERLSGVKRGTHLHARRLQRGILGVTEQRRGDFFADLGVRRPYDRIAGSPSVQDAGVLLRRGTATLEDFRCEESVQAASLMGWKHLGAAAVDGEAACDVEYAVDRKRNQSGPVMNKDEAVFAVEWRGRRGPVRLGCLPVHGDDVVHRLHQRRPVGVADLGGIRKAEDLVVGPPRRDRLVLAAQISRHGGAPTIRSPAIQAGLEWLKGQYALEICQIPAARPARKTAREADRDRRFSRRDPARYFRSGAGLRRTAGDRTAGRGLRPVLSFDVGWTGANGRRDDG